MDKARTLLFATTGFGNSAFRVLKDNPLIELIGVFTLKRENSPFPYYKCEKLQEEGENSGIALYEGLSLKERKTCALISKLSPDLIIVSTFYQIIPDEIISLPKFGVINVHPSLLPKYRGPTPTSWALINGEKETGVTVHFIDCDKKIDSGRVISQAKLKIEPSDDDGALRYKLACLSEEVLRGALRLILGERKEIFPEQNEAEATYFPKRTIRDAEIDLNWPLEEIRNRIMAMSPYPGAFISHNGKRYVIRDVAMLNQVMGEIDWQARNKS